MTARRSTVLRPSRLRCRRRRRKRCWSSTRGAHLEQTFDLEAAREVAAADGALREQAARDLRRHVRADHRRALLDAQNALHHLRDAHDAAAARALQQALQEQHTRAHVTHTPPAEH